MENDISEYKNNNFIIKQQVDELYDKLIKSSATFIYNPNELNKIRTDIFNLQENCNHKYENGKCIYCRKEQENAD